MKDILDILCEPVDWMGQRLTEPPSRCSRADLLLFLLPPPPFFVLGGGGVSLQATFLNSLVVFEQEKASLGVLAELFRVQVVD